MRVGIRDVELDAWEKRLRIFENIDCMKGMARYQDKYFDLAIVDPPYGIGLDFQFKCGYGKSIHIEKQWNNEIPTEEYFKELHRVSKHQIIWGCNYYAKYINGVGRIIHDKKIRTDGLKINFSEADIASCSKQKRITIFEYRWNGNRQGETINWNNDGIDRRIHPTQKPVALYKYLLKNYAKEGDLILDTHVGSASSLIACIDMGFDYVGFEIDKDYYNAAKKRIEIFESQTNLFRDVK